MLGSPMYSLGIFVLDERHQLLLKDGQRVNLAKKPYTILIFLVENRDRLVTRSELLGRFWDGKDVYEQTLTRAVARIRSALGDDQGEAQFIETRWATGYQYVGPFREMASGGNQPATETDVTRLGVDNRPESTSLPQELPLPQADVATRQKPGFGRAAWLIFALAALVGAAILWPAKHVENRQSQSSTNASVHPVRTAVATMPFRNLSGDAKVNWLSTAIAEMVSTELSSDGRVRSVPGDEISRAQKELGIHQPIDLSAPTLAALHNDLFADAVVSGNYSVLDLGASGQKRVRLDFKVQDARTGETLLSGSEQGNLGELFELSSATGSRVLAALVSPATPTLSPTLTASLPTDSEALQEYMEGLKSLRAEDLAAAEQHLEKSIAHDFSCAMTHLLLADVFGLRGFQEKQRSEAKLADSLSTGLSREQHLMVEGRYASTIGDWEKAVKDYQALFTFYPDDIEYGLSLANALTSAGKPLEAKATVEKLREVPGPTRDDPRIDLEAASAEQSMSDARAAAADAQRAVEKAQMIGARLLYAHALAVKAGNMAAIDMQESIRETEEVRRVCDRLNDAGCVANALRRLGIFAVNTNPAGAQRYLTQALQIARKIGCVVEEDNDLNGLAAVLSNQNDFRSADTMYRELLQNAREMNSGWGIQMALNNLGNDLYQEGNLEEARNMQVEALAVSRRIGLKAAAGDELLSLSQIDLVEGNAAQSKIEAEEAIAIFGALHNEESRAAALSARGAAERVMGRLEQARIDQQEALEILIDHKDLAVLAESRLDLARTDLEAGHAEVAVELAERAATEFAGQKMFGEEANARATLALALAQQGQQALAQQQMYNAQKLLGNVQGELARDEVQIDAALLQARIFSMNPNPNPNTVLVDDSLAQLSVRAEKHHLKLIAMEARIAQAEVDWRKSSAQENRSRVQIIEIDAQKTGYQELARRAQQLLARLPPEPSRSL
jgi:eukaryotic-like serine/threonine-protein kinase